MAAQTILLVTKKGETDPPEPTAVARDQILKIGRAGTLRIHDVLVNPQHAKVYYDPAQGSWVVEDLGSSNGTFINNQCVRSAVKRITIGTTLKFGDTVIRVEGASGSLRWMLTRTAIAVPGCLALVVSAVGAVLGIAWLFSGSSTFKAQELSWKNEIMGPDSRSKKVKVPPAFPFRHGITDMFIEEVTDEDNNGIDELWLDADGGTRSFLVEPNRDGDWTLLGEFPRASDHCTRQDLPGGFPLVNCDSEKWMFEPERAQYRAVEYDGPVVFYIKAAKKAVPDSPLAKAKAKAPAEPEPPAPEPTSMFRLTGSPEVHVGRFSLKDTERMGQFLGERGVYEPVHYLLCEDAFPELQAQVVTYQGVVRELKPACIQHLRLDAPNLKENWQPVAIAFTPAGYRALMDDVITFYSGGPDGLWASADKRKVIAQLKKDPGVYTGGTKLIVETNHGVPYPDPRAFQGSELAGARLLLAKDRQAKPAPPSEMVVLLGPGVREVPVGGGRCERFLVQWTARKGGCGGAGTVRVDEIGCGDGPRPILSRELTSGASDGSVGDLDVRVAVETVGLEGRLRSVKLTWRLKAWPEAVVP